MKAIVLSVILLGVAESASSQIKFSERQILNAVNVGRATLSDIGSSLGNPSATFKKLDSEKLAFVYSTRSQFYAYEDLDKIATNAKVSIPFGTPELNKLSSELVNIQTETHRIKEAGGTQSAIRFYKTSSPRINSTGQVMGTMRWFSEKKFEIQ